MARYRYLIPIRDHTLRNGAFVALGDVNSDGNADIAFGGGPGGGPRVRLFDGAKLLSAGTFGNLDDIAGMAQLANFFAGDSSLRGGVPLVMSEVNGDGKADLVTSSGEGDVSRIRVYRSANLLGNPSSADQVLDPFGLTLANGVYVGSRAGGGGCSFCARPSFGKSGTSFSPRFSSGQSRD